MLKLLKDEAELRLKWTVFMDHILMGINQYMVGNIFLTFDYERNLNVINVQNKETKSLYELLFKRQIYTYKTI